MSNYDDNPPTPGCLQIGAAYIEARDASSDPEVRRLYAQYAKETSVLFNLIRARVEFTEADPYKTAKEMREEVLRTGVMRVFSGGNDHPILTPEQNLRGRAVHDLLAHLVCGCPFTGTGEFNAFEAQAALYSVELRMLIFTEIVGQTCAYLVNSERHVEQKAVLLDEKYEKLGEPMRKRFSGMGLAGVVEAGLISEKVFEIATTRGYSLRYEYAVLETQSKVAANPSVAPKWAKWIQQENTMRRLPMSARRSPEVRVAISPEGDILYVGDSQEEAVDVARSVAPVVLIDDERQGFSSNPPIPMSTDRAPHNSAKASGVPHVSFEDVEAMSVQEAFERISPFFKKIRWFAKKQGEPKKRWRTGAELDKNNSATSLIDSFLTTNEKIDKRLPDMPNATVLGLSFLPHALVKEVVQNTDPMTGFGEFKSDFDALDLPANFTLCTHATKECKATCLTYVGHNWMVFYNAKLKAAKTIAFLSEPVAFMRLLYEAIKKLQRSKKRNKFCRLNVLSDVCWEIVAPWIFEKIQGVQFYDYTKIPGRNTPDNYDLTFSYAGTPANKKHCESELARGRRIAVVFIGYKRVGEEWKPLGKLKGPELLEQFPQLPPTFMGYPIVDGDISDLRPLEPGGVVVGLRFKTSGLKTANPDFEKFSFATGAHIISSTESELRDSTKRNPPGEEIQWLVAAATPRALEDEDDPIDDDPEGDLQLDERIEETDGEIDITPSGQLGMAP